MTPIFKKGDKSSVANYRPTSLSCILCKVLGYIIASLLVKHMKSHDLLYDLQHGFRENRSCETQLTTLVEDLTRSRSAGNRLVLLDFSKAFDKVNHSKLIWKLLSAGSEAKHLAGFAPSWGIDRSQ